MYFQDLEGRMENYVIMRTSTLSERKRVKRFWDTWSADIVTTFFWIPPPKPHIENRSILDKKKELTHLSTQPQ
jgi:hypothetical protein